ncbi:hypothetical protein [Melittangium boletus]|uniref:Lipoprotein n=1 Tax=Melittangium boletus DSM 14713 TaxID=1294270 RepID=A0A250I7N3_9BACT|nr:hypothetical protein [Melittangium boletus]ATB27874.1 hypothetical protein MEBOL_001319 [Melittangium boletus DSM 14713]
MSRRAWNALVLAGFVATGCGLATDSPIDPGTENDGGGEVRETRGSLLPWAEGNRWTYRVTEAGEVSEKETTVGPLEEAERAHRVTSRKSSGAITLSWQTVSGARVVRYREQSFEAGATTAKDEEWWNPAKLHVDLSPEHTVKGVSWVEIYQETKQKAGKTPSTETTRDLWTVLSEAESVTVPAGTFTAVVLRKTGTSKTKTYWFVRGIGKVKETGEETEELLSYEVAPEPSTD